MERFVRGIESGFHQKKKKLIYKMINSFRKPVSRDKTIVDDSGEVINEPEQINNKWTEYFTNLLNVPQAGPENEEDEIDRGRDRQRKHSEYGRDEGCIENNE